MAGREGVLIIEGTEIQSTGGDLKSPVGRGDKPLSALAQEQGRQTALEAGDLKPEALDRAATSLLSVLVKSQDLGEPVSLLSVGLCPISCCTADSLAESRKNGCLIPRWGD